jgi:hypothetical protein
MNITRLNFTENIQYIKSIIKKSNFIAIDLEMSGIVSERVTNPTITDSVLYFVTPDASQISKDEKTYIIVYSVAAGTLWSQHRPKDQ